MWVRKINGKITVGLTGMSGAGKSTVCGVFRKSGFDVIDCDLCAREIAQSGMPFLRELSERFSAEVIRSDGSLDRRKTAEIIFNSPEKRELYNKIIYPYITYNITVKIKRCGGLVLLDAPTLFEARLMLLCDYIVSVVADKSRCIDRITMRDNIPRELAAARLDSQHSEEFFRSRSDFCIENNGGRERLFSQAAGIIDSLKGAK